MESSSLSLPRGAQGDLKRQTHAVFYARDYETGLKIGRSLIEQYRDCHETAMACLKKSQDECLMCLRLPESHRKRVCTTNGV